MSYRDLIAWQKSMDLAEELYLITRDFPADERFGLVAQLRRAGVSVPCNIAEGDGRLTTRDWQHFLSQARGSVQEVETQLILSNRLGFGHEQALLTTLQHAEEVNRVINGLLRSTRSRSIRKPL